MLEYVQDGCFSFQFYIKPQPVPLSMMLLPQLFLIPILHQTTTKNGLIEYGGGLFLIPILHQTTTG